MEVSATLDGSDRAGVLVERHRRLRHTRGSDLSTSRLEGSGTLSTTLYRTDGSRQGHRQLPGLFTTLQETNSGRLMW